MNQITVKSYKFAADGNTYIRLQESGSSYLKQGMDVLSCTINFSMALSSSKYNWRGVKTYDSPSVTTVGWNETITGSFTHPELVIKTPVLHQNIVAADGFTASLKSINHVHFDNRTKAIEDYITFF